MFSTHCDPFFCFALTSHLFFLKSSLTCILPSTVSHNPNGFFGSLSQIIKSKPSEGKTLNDSHRYRINCIQQATEWHEMT